METIKKWQERFAEIVSTPPNPLVEEKRKGACRDAEIADLRAALATQAESAPVVSNVIPRAPWDDNVPDGMLESDNDYVEKNIGAAVALLDAALAQRAASVEAAPVAGQEKIYQISQPFPADPLNTWRDASEDAYALTGPDKRRVVYTAPIPAATSAPDGVDAQAAERRAMFAAYSECLTSTNMLPNEIADKLLSVVIAAQPDSERDAARYRFLEAQCRTGSYRGIIDRAAIDAAMAVQQGEKGGCYEQADR